MQDRYDVVIVGAGISGLWAAMHLDQACRVLVLAKQELRLCNSSLAQGGVAAVLDQKNDSFDLHIEDTLIAGGHENRLAAVEVLVQEGPDQVRQVLDLGAEFDSHDGQLHMTLEGGHCRKRIVHHKDSTGEEIMRVLVQAAKTYPNVEIAENAGLCFLDRIQGGYSLTVQQNGEFYTLCTPVVILATGGVGRVYQYTTNSAIATGDGIAMAYDLGAKIENLHYIQFHPTAFAAAAGRERFLISEAVRGEGAVLLNGDRQRFMHRYDQRLELAPRDVVSRSIILESRRTGNEQFYLDIAFKSAEFIKDRFPMIYSRCLHEGVDITKEPIPVFPCQHYLMGGIDVDLHSRTRLEGLYAVGECAHTGVHGKNRLASNSLLEALVFGRRAAEHINATRHTGVALGKPVVHPTNGAPMPQGLRTTIRRIMQRAYFVLPDTDAAIKLRPEVEQVLKRLYRSGFGISKDYIEARSLARVADIILGEVIH